MATRSAAVPTVRGREAQARRGTASRPRNGDRSSRPRAPWRRPRRDDPRRRRATASTPTNRPTSPTAPHRGAGEAARCRRPTPGSCSGRDRHPARSRAGCCGRRRVDRRARCDTRQDRTSGGAMMYTPSPVLHVRRAPVSRMGYRTSPSRPAVDRPPRGIRDRTARSSDTGHSPCGSTSGSARERVSAASSRRYSRWVVNAGTAARSGIVMTEGPRARGRP